MRGGREMENHFECLWDLFRSIPSLEKPGASVLDEYYWLNKHDPNYSLCRATVNRGEDAHTDGKFNLSQKGCMEIMKLFMTKDEDLYDKTIEDVFDDEVFNSTFWLYWRTMFAFRELAQRTGDEALFPAFHPSHCRTAGFQCPEIHQIQSVRIPDPSDEEIPGGCRR